MQGIEDLTFSFATVIQLVAFVIALVSGWGFMKKNFEANKVKLERVEEDLKSNAEDVTSAIERISLKIDGIHSDNRDQHLELVRLTGSDDLLAQRITAIENQI